MTGVQTCALPIYAGSGSINTSDANKKTDVESLSLSEKACALELKANLVKFRMVDAVASKGDDARIHTGIIAQTVKSIFESHGLDAHRYGLFCYDQEANGSESYGIRYSELLTFIVAAL